MSRLIKFLTALMLIAVGNMPAVNAEIQTYEGVGIYHMAKTSETLNQAKNEAKKYAGRAILEQIELYIASESEVRDFNLTKDEIVTIAAGVMNVTSAKYRYMPEEADPDQFVVECLLTAEVDTDRVHEYVERERQARLQR